MENDANSSDNVITFDVTAHGGSGELPRARNITFKDIIHPSAGAKVNVTMTSCTQANCVVDVRVTVTCTNGTGRVTYMSQNVTVPRGCATRTLTMDTTSSESAAQLGNYVRRRLEVVFRRNDDVRNSVNYATCQKHLLQLASCSLYSSM